MTDFEQGPDPYVGGHPEMPLHPYEPSGTGTCRACERQPGCANCGHALAHHGHYEYDHDTGGRWVDESRCWVYVAAERTASGRRKGKPGCKCSGWSTAGQGPDGLVIDPGKVPSAREPAVSRAVAPVCKAGVRGTKRGRRVRAAQ